jgi:hypothetical protein
MASFEFLAIILTGIGLIVSILYYAFTLQNANKTRKTQLFTQIYQARYNPKNIERWWKMMSWEWDTFDEYYDKYGGFEVNPETAALSIAQYTYYDGLGMLVIQNMVDVHTVFQLMSAPIIAIWFKFETVIKGMRAMVNGPGENYMESFEFLAEEMIRLRQEKGMSLPLSFLHKTSTLIDKYNP